jgi:hypothetical protein
MADTSNTQASSAPAATNGNARNGDGSGTVLFSESFSAAEAVEALRAAAEAGGSASASTGSGTDSAASISSAHSASSPWLVVRGSPSAIRFGGGSLELSNLPGFLWGRRSDKSQVNNILLMRNRYWPPLAASSSDSSLNGSSNNSGAASAAAGGAVLVSLRHVQRSSGEQAGLIVYADDDNYVKLVCEYLKGVPMLVWAVEERAEPRVLAKQPSPLGTAAATAATAADCAEIALRIRFAETEKDVLTMTAEYTLDLDSDTGLARDGASWRSIGEPHAWSGWRSKQTIAGFGIIVMGGEPDSGRATHFRQLRLVTLQ